MIINAIPPIICASIKFISIIISQNFILAINSNKLIKSTRFYKKKTLPIKYFWLQIIKYVIIKYW